MLLIKLLSLWGLAILERAFTSIARRASTSAQAVRSRSVAIGLDLRSSMPGLVPSPSPVTQRRGRKPSAEAVSSSTVTTYEGIAQLPLDASSLRGTSGSGLAD